MADNFQSEQAFVAMFDILGFKALRREKGTTALAADYDNIVFGAIQDANSKHSST